MSSLRLALKQSLQESASLASSSLSPTAGGGTDGRISPGATNASVSTSPQTLLTPTSVGATGTLTGTTTATTIPRKSFKSISASGGGSGSSGDHQQLRRKRGRPRKHFPGAPQNPNQREAHSASHPSGTNATSLKPNMGHSQDHDDNDDEDEEADFDDHHDDDDMSSEQEFSGAFEDDNDIGDEDEEGERRFHRAQEGKVYFTEPSSGPGKVTQQTTSHTSARHHPSPHDHAAHKIQSRWKKAKGGADKVKKSSSTSEAYLEQGLIVDDDTDVMGKSQGRDASADTMEIGAEYNDTSSPQVTKSKTVPAPAPDVLEWMRSLPPKRARRYVMIGLRVKVRFATTVKRDGKLVRRKKWYGGRIAGVFKEGTKVRIIYDDGTTEKTKFPDKDICIDAVDNGEHDEEAITADKFLPRPTSASSASTMGPRGEDLSAHLQHMPEEQFQSKLSSKDQDDEVDGAATNAATITGELPTAEDASTASAIPALDVTRTESSFASASDPIIEEQDTAASKSTLVPPTVVSKGQGHAPPSPELAADTFEGESIKVDQLTSAVDKLPDAVSDGRVISLSSGADEEELEGEMISSGAEAVDDGHGSTSARPPDPVKVKRKRGRPPKNRSVLTTSSDNGVTAPSDSTTSSNTNLLTAMTSVAPGVAGIQALDGATGDSSSSLGVEATNLVLSSAKMSETILGIGDGFGKNEDVALPDAKPSLIIRIPAGIAKMKKQHVPEEVAAIAVVGDDDSRKNTLLADFQHSSVENFEERGTGSCPATDGSESATTTTNAANRGKRSADDVSSDWVEPNPKRLHIHIPVAKVLSEDKQNRTTSTIDEALLPNRGSLTAEESEVGKDMLDRLSGHTVEPESPSSLKRSKKLRRERMEGEDRKTSDSPTIAKGQLFAQTKSQVGELYSPKELMGTDLEASVLASKYSAFERKPVIPSEVFEEYGPDQYPLDEDGAATPRARGKQQEIAPIVRSGRRAAQQANERIVSRQEVVIPELSKKKKRKRKDGEEDVEEQPEGDSQWVQCDKCGKWRIIPSKVVSSLPTQWYCADNIYDSKRASCEAPEQTDKDVAKERKRLKRRQQRLMMEANAAGGGTISEDAIRERAIDRVRSPHPKEDIEDQTKNKRLSPVEQVNSSDGSKEGQPRTTAKQSSSLIKKAKVSEGVEGMTSFENANDGRPSRRGRPRRAQNAAKEAEPSIPSGHGHVQSATDEADNLEWVQCEKCEKWRKLPPHISADELPEVWYCALNDWNPASGSCDAPEDKAEGVQDVGIFGSSGSLAAGKLSYRNLIFGSTGRKANRPVSERTRAAESLFGVLNDDDDTPPTVMYANSSAFVSRSKVSHSSDENEGRSVFELLAHSRLWAELSGSLSRPFSTHNSTLDTGDKMQKPLRTFALTYENLPQDVKQPVKDLLLFLLEGRTLGEHDILEAARLLATENGPVGWEVARSYFTINVVITTLCELAKAGQVECVYKNLNDLNLRYRRCDAKVPVRIECKNRHHESRCMKIAKPWKRGMVQ